ncbi:MAG: hypothetical protein COA99_09245 [Moraxellaceae bacterium]|nr:MAG: hypothetical protein COA99_09245 [Moraxellaceae bacterium]
MTGIRYKNNNNARSKKDLAMNTFIVTIRYLLFFSLSALSLTGCGGSITSAFPDPDATIYSNSGETLTFTVTGSESDDSDWNYKWRASVLSATSISNHRLSSNGEKSRSILLDESLTSATAIIVTCQYKNSNKPNQDDSALDTITWIIKPQKLQHSLTSTGSLYIQNSNDIASLENITSLKGSLRIGDVNFDASAYLSSITEIEGYLALENNRRIPPLNWFKNLTSVGGLSITNSDLTTSLSALNNLTSIEHGISINNNDAITSLDGLKNLEYFNGGLRVSDNKSLSSLSGLENITSIAGDLNVSNNPKFTSFSGLENIQAIHGQLKVMQNPNLRSFSGLENLQTVESNLLIDTNLGLRSLSGLENLQTVGGKTTITGNLSLDSLSGLEQLESTAGLDIAFNWLLKSVSGLENLTFIDGTFWVAKNTRLTSLSGLENVQSIDGHIRIETNNSLTSVTELSSLSHVGGNFHITDNKKLCNFNAVELVQQIESQDGLDGEIDINNTGSCRGQN